ncbi:restriction endonuclease subunit S [Vibrio vulnificus]|uniref:restriction endonuclease subunit S n=1 Tax=Vibrio vulnificus TaxID=672 RepID=UPI000F4D976A|nr:restriction endonuclease subunit S [Vibrio vulnificus]MCA3984983.1 restriction endonuclease subunit S [Vibrio vulnificus]RPB30124.1 restriction endonuclease subunit S [Vibrio vulnificus]
MAGRYKAYPEYKSTDEVWLGNVPSHWRDLKINRLTIVKRGASPRPIDDPKYFDEAGEYSWVRIADVTASDTYLENTPQRLSPLGASLSVKLEPNELFLSIAGTVGKPCINKIKVCIHDGFVYFPEYKENTKFLFYIFAAGEAYKGLGKFGTQLNLNTETVGGIKIGIPCIEEQHKIVNFLDHETAKIDTLIAKQEKLIELLKEKRQAVISHAVTKGLNPQAPMKDSGVEWLGEVPEHWEVTKLKWKTSTTSGGTPTTSKYEMYYQDGYIPWIRTTDLNNGKLLETPVNITSKALADTACSILPKNSILLAMYGGAGSIGKHSLLMFEATINQAVCGIYPSSAFESEFLHYFYEFYRPFWMINAAGTRKDPNIGQDHIKEGKVVLPPVAEQRTIVAHINKTLALLDRLNVKATDAIELAKERKTALISAAVTGKIDVRDWEFQGVEG